MHLILLTWASLVQSSYQGSHEVSFKYYPIEKTWSEANEYCKEHLGGADQSSMLGSLAVVQSDSLRDLVHQQAQQAEGKQVWIGHRRREAPDDTKWESPDGNLITYQSWAGGQPDKPGEGEDCVAQYKKDSKWHDWPCNSKMTFVCQFARLSVDDCCRGDCYSYSGDISDTDEGLPCKDWSDVDKDYDQRILKANYCRNPSNHPNAWCAVVGDDPTPWWKNCQIPACPEETILDCCEHDKQCKDYRGYVSRTVSGRECRLATNDDGKNQFTHPNTGMEVAACRNPADRDVTWCYTTDPKKNYEDCKLPVCSDVPKRLVINLGNTEYLAVQVEKNIDHTRSTQVTHWNLEQVKDSKSSEAAAVAKSRAATEDLEANEAADIMRESRLGLIIASGRKYLYVRQARGEFIGAPWDDGPAICRSFGAQYAEGITPGDFEKLYDVLSPDEWSMDPADTCYHVGARYNASRSNGKMAESAASPTGKGVRKSDYEWLDGSDVNESLWKRTRPLMDLERAQLCFDGPKEEAGLRESLGYYWRPLLCELRTAWPLVGKEPPAAPSMTARTEL